MASEHTHGQSSGEHLLKRSPGDAGWERLSNHVSLLLSRRLKSGRRRKKPSAYLICQSQSLNVKANVQKNNSHLGILRQPNLRRKTSIFFEVHQKPGFQAARLQRQIQYFSFSLAVARKSMSLGGLLYLVKEAKVFLNWSHQLHIRKTTP